MTKSAVIFLLSLGIGILICIAVYQQIVFRRGLQGQLREISRKLGEIIEQDTDESIMVFTDNSVLTALAAQINCLLDSSRKTKAEYRRAAISSKKMLSNISHDIKTPMTVILGYLEIMRLDGRNNNEMVEKAEQKGKQVMELINQFFTLAKLESGDMDIEVSKINISEICRENILDFYEILSKQDFQVDIDIPKEEVFALGDTDAVRRILFNLISNSVRYGAEGKYLGIRLGVRDRFVYIDIIDKGRGIEKAFADTVFERLFTMEDSRNRDVQGNGLGLTIARGLARQLGGDIILESEPYVKTLFTLKLKKISY